ncbi:MFS transporter [Stygiolobus caldivivus]|uniref:MFS transporter n=1 Tax=Stygiolobus caldivivus TaxID=2824673 RepID=A0A8D5ZJV8_9CREN|nr:MFS transporter [Stygiolobus caldivivus]BCU71056.1 MFS transporter [Stygiolobus caldivivus]
MASNKSLLLVVVVLGVLMGAVDSTIVILALPTIVTDLHSDLFTMIWIILIYLLEVAVLTTQLGRLGDSYGRARIYNLGFIVFTIGSALCGASPSAYFLIGSRGVQALGASMMQANSGAIISDNFPPNTRGKAFGYTSIGWNVGAILGIVLGGIITTLIGWRYIFYINVPIGIAASILGFKVVKDVNKVKRDIDIYGILLFGSSLALITYGSADIAGEGLALKNEIPLTIGLLLLIPFVIVEQRVKSPLIDFKIFKNRVLTSSLFASFLQSTGYLSTAFLLIMYLQGIRGLSPLNASLLLVPGYVIAGMIGPLAGRLSDKIGSRIPATIGIGLMAFVSFLYSHLLSLTTPLIDIIFISVIGGIGSSLFYPANNSAVMANTPKHAYGSVSGMLRTLSNTGILLSYVISITVASLTVPRYVAFEVFLGTSDLIGGVATKFITGLHSAFLVSVGILAVALVLSAIRGKEIRAQASEGTV